MFQTGFRRTVDIKFRTNPSSGNRVVPSGQKEGQADRNEGFNCRFSQICERT